MTDAATAQAAAAASGSVEVFTFGEPESVLDRGEFLLMLEAGDAGRYYTPPISMIGLVKAHRMSAHHSSAIALKRNLLCMSLRPTKLMPHAEFEKIVTNYLATGNCYIERIDNIGGRALTLKNSPAIHTRVGKEAGQYFFLQPGKPDHEYRRGSICHLLEPDLAQEIYGVPEWYAALQSGLLNEAATLFRRRYYKNGSHAGFVFYVAEEGLSEVDSKAIREAFRQSKGPGNFRNLYLHIPKGREKGVQILPISEVAARDEFTGIKNATRDDILAAHRTPPQLIGVVPSNAAGFGSITDAARVFFDHEIVPLQRRFLQINAWLGYEAIRFGEYAPSAAAA
ncbi:MAG: phage portal protein [Alphaproteobacteria bacterium HGW-Alphaproteobacteria-13]|nr:MAG: phage portal protein [Alphaproteobacteria bacterium HGW-Alphaproteobacteria-13]